MSARLIAIGVAIALMSGAQVKSIPHSESGVLLYTVAPQYKPLAWLTGSDRFPQGASIFIQDAHGRRPLMKNFAASADPSVSFDATRVLFAGKKQADQHWQIWELQLATGLTRQVSSCSSDCIHPLYLPDDRVTYAKRTKNRFALVVGPLIGGDVLALTFAPGSFLPTDVLRDGRILFEAAQPLATTGAVDLYTVYSDGSGVEAYRCDHGPRRHSGKQLRSGDVVFSEGRGLARFTSALANAVKLELPGGDYAGDVAESPAGEWLASLRIEANTNYSIFQWNPSTRRLNPIITERHSNAVQPTLLSERSIPNRHPSALHDWSYANLLCLNAYTSKFPFKRASIASVRLYTRAASGDEKLLGETTVEKDGSFYLKTPADQPLKVELLDSGGKTLKREAGWFWLRRGEQRVCVGCHAGPETAPENVVPAVLLRSTIAADMTGTGHFAAGGHGK
jgi:hypothetical protein